MVISDRVRLLFVHVQKTGGSTIHNRLSEVLPDARQVKGLERHSQLAQILRAEPELSSYWTFGVVRNPWSRMLSWYNMVDRFRGDEDSKSKLDRKNGFIRSVAEACPDFESFVMVGLDEFKRLQIPQVRYLTTKHRRADFIGRQETLEADLRAVQAKFEIEWTPLQSVNIDRSRPDYKSGPELGGRDTRYREFYTDAMQRRVEAVFARDVQAFGYEF
ncbi:sulfotransferase family 2 domain-containing protein [Nocardioides acrostichi]|uniref:Sulfotransferase family 2 domain-containing protein n=1 Tax=Nocardioides acrostichi TaxID=2784339 RepID=A0A930Y6G5_9ACTN|nr:sulfotransferase family 2 domain-containing protein [Nocardioides acrostichi]MBF4160957.1 sulfotransferase family 2 domain-containing protein [Nocardioides acrostichi]